MTNYFSSLFVNQYAGQYIYTSIILKKRDPGILCEMCMSLEIIEIYSQQ